MKTLHLTLKKKWFDMVASGEKKEEYREIKDYWTRRLTEIMKNGVDQATVFRTFDRVEFRNGYGKDAPKILMECRGVEVDYGFHKWGAGNQLYYVIKLGKRL